MEKLASLTGLPQSCSYDVVWKRLQVKREVKLKGKTSMRTNNPLYLIEFFRSVVALTVVTIAPESNGTWNENLKEKHVIGHP